MTPLGTGCVNLRPVLRSHCSETWHNAAKIVGVDWEKINSNADLIPSPSNISSLTEPFYNDEEILAVAADLFDLVGLAGHTRVGPGQKAFVDRLRHFVGSC